MKGQRCRHLRHASASPVVAPPRHYIITQPDSADARRRRDADSHRLEFVTLCQCPSAPRPIMAILLPLYAYVSGLRPTVSSDALSVFEVISHRASRIFRHACFLTIRRMPHLVGRRRARDGANTAFPAADAGIH